MSFTPVFPTRVGVNRKSPPTQFLDFSIPHARGGEPNKRLISAEVGVVFPTRVGVNRNSPLNIGRE